MSASNITFTEKFSGQPDTVYTVGGLDPETFGEIADNEYVTMSGVTYERLTQTSTEATFESVDVADLPDSVKPVRLPDLRNMVNA